VTPAEAAQIAKLLNERNQLVVTYDEAKVLGSAKNYIHDVSSAGRVSQFFNAKSNNQVGIWQKVISLGP
jgi:glutaredoxin-related protein